jgi:stage II sporulation protein Q
MIAEVIIMREEEKKHTSRKSKFQRILKKRWALPAIYIVSAAIILAAALIIQNGFNDSASPAKKTETGKNLKEPAVEVNSKLEDIKSPVTDAEATVIKKQFYDVHGTKQAKEAALVSYNNRYEPNKGIDIAMKDGKTFDVVASLSGTVKNVKEDALLGNEVTIEHENGVVTHYQSVNDIAVKVGNEVKQGQVLAKAGQSLLNEEAGIHVHFEIRKDTVALNPIDLIDKPVSSIGEQKAETAGSKDDSNKGTEKDAANQSDDKAPGSDQQNTDQKKGTSTDTNADSKQQNKENSNATNGIQDSTQN